MDAGRGLAGVRALRAVSEALDHAPGLDEGLAAAARALVPALADGCEIWRRDDAGDRLVASVGADADADADPAGRRLELPLTAHGRTRGGLRLVRAATGADWDELERLLAGEAAVRFAHALVRDDDAAAVASARVYDAFLATLSHELRSPLNVIIGWVGLLRGDRLDGERRAQALAVIARNTEVQTRLIEDLVEASRIVAGNLRLVLGELEAHELVPGTVEALRPQAEAAGISLAIRADAAFCLRGDGVRLAQVVSNLVGNALRFTPSGGRVEVSLRQEGADAVLAVIDDGVGIAPELLPHVFERFWQGDHRRAGGSKGLGLGLFIVDQIVRRHGGTVVATSAGPGAGATFTVRLPLSGPPDVTAASR